MSSETRDEQRRRVLEVASGLFAEHGLDDVTMAEIAEAADVARATVFNYFGSKYALVEAITEGVMDFYRAMLDEALADGRTPTPDLVRGLFEDMGKGIESQRRFFREVFREITRIQLGLDEGAVAQSASDAVRSRLVELMERGQARGDITDTITAAALADAFHSLSNGTITTWLYQDPSQPLVTRMQDAADVFLSPIAHRYEEQTMTTVDLNRYDPLAATVQTDPYPYYDLLRRDAPVHFVESIGAYAVSRHADVKRVMHDHATFSSAAMAALVARPVRYSADARAEEVEEGLGVSIIGTDGDKHARLRTIVNRGFTPRRTAEMEDDMRRIARSFAQPLAESGAGDLQAGLAIPFPTSVIAALLGVDPDRRDEFRRWSELMVFAVFEPTNEEQRAEVARASDQMTVWLDETIAERDGTGGEDLVSVLLRAEAEGGALTHDELGVFVITLLVAGSITTAYLIGAAAMALARDPLLQAEARGDSAVVAAVIEETLRHETPTQMMFRLTTTDVEIADTTIPSGATVTALLGSANRDERVFPDAARFDHTRNTTDQLAFGHGVHFCLGAALARLEARIAIEELLASAPRLELTAEIEPVTSLVFRGPKSAEFAYR